MHPDLLNATFPGPWAGSRAALSVCTLTVLKAGGAWGEGSETTHHPTHLSSQSQDVALMTPPVLHWLFDQMFPLAEVLTEVTGP